MTFDGVITIVLLFAAFCFLVLCVYIYLRNRSFQDIREDVYQLFLMAEHVYKESGTGKQKMEWVIHRARQLLPSWLQFFMSDQLLCKVVQTWFRAVKDLLDDGKYNQSIEQGGNENDSADGL